MTLLAFLALVPALTCGGICAYLVRRRRAVVAVPIVDDTTPGPGRFTVRGQVALGPGQVLLTSPINQRPCCWWQVEIDRYWGENPVTIAERSSGKPFAVGRAVVDAAAVSALVHDIEIDDDAQLAARTRAAAWLASIGIDNHDDPQSMRVRERVLEPGSEAWVTADWTMEHRLPVARSVDTEPGTLITSTAGRIDLARAITVSDRSPAEAMRSLGVMAAVMGVMSVAWFVGAGVLFLV